MTLLTENCYNLWNDDVKETLFIKRTWHSTAGDKIFSSE